MFFFAVILEMSRSRPQQITAPFWNTKTVTNVNGLQSAYRMWPVSSDNIQFITILQWINLCCLLVLSWFWFSLYMHVLFICSLNIMMWLCFYCQCVSFNQQHTLSTLLKIIGVTSSRCEKAQGGSCVKCRFPMPPAKLWIFSLIFQLLECPRK